MRTLTSQVPPAIALSLLFAASAWAEKPATAETTEANVSEVRQQTIVITGDDAELVKSVAAELRAAGFVVVIVAHDTEANANATVVNIERIGDSVVVHATPWHGELRAELLDPADSDGMTDLDATALRTAEAIRSLVTTPIGEKRSASPGANTADDHDAPDAATSSESPSINTDPPPVPPATIRPKMDVAMRHPPHDRIPVFRMGLFGGAGFLAPSPAMVVGLSMRGQLSPDFNIAGLLMGSKNIGDVDFGSGAFDIFSARATMLTSWEMLGANHAWTPSLGAGVFGDVRRWVRVPFGGDMVPLSGDNVLMTTIGRGLSEGSAAGVGLAMVAGISVSHPWRLRFDVHANMQLFTVELDGGSHDEMAPTLEPSVLGTIGFEYDFVTRPTVEHTARR